MLCLIKIHFGESYLKSNYEVGFWKHNQLDTITFDRYLTVNLCVESLQEEL